MASPMTDEIDRTLAASELPWIRYARTTLQIVGVGYIVLGLATAPLIYFSFMSDPDIATTLGGAGPAIAISIAAFTLLFAVGLGALNFFAASGLRYGRKWSWFATLILGLLYVPSLCLPFGAILLYAMLQERVRTLYLS